MSKRKQQLIIEHKNTSYIKLVFAIIIIAILGIGWLSYAYFLPPAQANYDEEFALGYELGYAEGFSIGFTQGNNTGFVLGNETGYSDGYQAGYDIAKDYWTNWGIDYGYLLGLLEGNSTGYQAGYLQGYQAAYQAGYSEGYLAGYETYLNATINDRVYYFNTNFDMTTPRWTYLSELGTNKRLSYYIQIKYRISHTPDGFGYFSFYMNDIITNAQNLTLKFAHSRDFILITEMNILGFDFESDIDPPFLSRTIVNSSNIVQMYEDSAFYLQIDPILNELNRITDFTIAFSVD